MNNRFVVHNIGQRESVLVPSHIKSTDAVAGVSGKIDTDCNGSAFHEIGGNIGRNECDSRVGACREGDDDHDHHNSQ